VNNKKTIVMANKGTAYVFWKLCTGGYTRYQEV